MAGTLRGTAQQAWSGGPGRARRWGEAAGAKLPPPWNAHHTHICSPIWNSRAPPPHMVRQPDLQCPPPPALPPRLAAFPATPGFVPIICIFSSSPRCRPNHKSFSGGALGKSPHASAEPRGLTSETPLLESSGPEGHLFCP